MSQLLFFIIITKMSGLSDSAVQLQKKLLTCMSSRPFYTLLKCVLGKVRPSFHEFQFSGINFAKVLSFYQYFIPFNAIYIVGLLKY